MTTIYCTKKVVEEAGFAGDLVRDSDSDSPLTGWYAHLFFRKRKKCLIFTNVRTLYSFVAESVSRSDIRTLDKLFRKELNRLLFYEEFSADVMVRMIVETENIKFGKASNRSVLGSMNDLIKQHMGYTERLEGEGRADLVAVNRQINRTPMGAMKYAFPIEKFKEALGFGTSKEKFVDFLV